VLDGSTRRVLDANTSCAAAKIEHGTQRNRTQTGAINMSIRRRLEESAIAGGRGSWSRSLLGPPRVAFRAPL